MEIGKINRPPPEIIEGFREIPTSTISDVLDKMGIEGIINGFQRLVSGIRIAGAAFTVKETSGVRGTYTKQDVPFGELFDMLEKGDIMVVDNTGRQISTLGDMASLALKLKGVAGAVVDGGVRDVEGIVRVGFPVYTRHTCATTAVTRIKFIALNVPVQVGDVKVNPGDIIVADDTAVAVVPADKAKEILEQCRQIEEIERQFEDFMREGGTFLQASRKFGRQ